METNADCVRSEEDVKLLPSEEDLRRLVHAIVTEFDGNTVAFYESIRPESGNKDRNEIDETAVREFQQKIASWR